jgi:hypothetical protein
VGFVASRLKSNIRLWRLDNWLLMEVSEIQSSVMDFVIHIVAKIVVPLFFIGMAGSAVVIVVSFAEDLKELFGDEE